MTERFLKAKHWQLFLLAFGVPFLSCIGLIVYTVVQLVMLQGDDATFLFTYYTWFPLIIAISMGTTLGWLWSVTTGLQPRVPVHLRMNLFRFKLFCIVPITYTLALAIFVGLIFAGIADTSDFDPDPVMVVTSVAIIVPLHLFSMFCIFHTIYYAAKTYKTVEFQKQVNFTDFIGEFFLAWFYFIGVWVLQPKINKMLTGEFPYKNSYAPPTV